jgi:xanthine dehydrogenase small subunit
VDGQDVEVADDGSSLLEVLRDRLGRRTVKDGCSPQGQCGCCTVLVDGVPRVACVTPARRVAGRVITTLDGLPEDDRRRWADAFCDAGASQCGFCTPGIIVRLAALGPAARRPERVETALLAHLCRCTGWRTIVAAAATAASHDPKRSAGPGVTLAVVAAPPAWHGPTHVPAAPAVSVPAAPVPRRRLRDLAAAGRRAGVEGGTAQRVGPDVALGHGGFADDLAPLDALVAVPDGAGGWAVGESLSAARSAAGKVQGRRSGSSLRHPLDLPEGDWAAALRTTWVEPGYVELDASWCRPGGEPAAPLGNGGAFGGKVASPAPAAARRLADTYGRPVRVLLSREDAVRLGPKRPPVAGGVRPDGTGVLRVVRTPGVAAAIAGVAPGIRVDEVDVQGPPTSASVRAAGWAEAAVLLAGAASAGGPVSITSPAGATATAEVDVDPAGLPVAVRVRLACGDPLDEVVLRSYAIGAAHMALGWVCSEGIAVGEDGEPEDLTIRSFGILRARDTPEIDVIIEGAGGPAVPGGDAVFAAVAAATWVAQGLPQDWPTRRGRFA